MMATITIATLDPRWRRALPGAAKMLRHAALAALGNVSRGPIDVALGDDRFLRDLNRDFRGRDKPTNVLSFPSGAAPGAGDLALALDTCQREARAQHKSLAQHVRHLIVHGTLHLRGFDHENAMDAITMEALERRTLRRLGLGDPYRRRRVL